MPLLVLHFFVHLTFCFDIMACLVLHSNRLKTFVKFQYYLVSGSCSPVFVLSCLLGPNNVLLEKFLVLLLT